MGEIVSGVATILLGQLATKAYQEIALACGLEDDVEKLRASMRFISAYLIDAENKQVNDLVVTEWLQQLKEAFYDASDILDEIEYETLRNQVVKEHGSAARKVRRFLSYSNPLAFRLKMSYKIRDKRERINEIASTRERFGLVVIDHHHGCDRSLIETLSWRETHSNPPSRITGGEQEKKMLINDLMRPNLGANKIDVIPVVGIGGLGKTTVAQLVYNDKRVVDNFPLRMWVCVFEEFEIKRLMLGICKAASGEERDAQSFNLEQVRTLLYKSLHGKKFLLVLDDVWNEDNRKWQQLEDVMLGLVDQGKIHNSKIIVTTRSHDVASITGNVPQYNLDELPEQESLELFLKCAFPKGGEEKHPRLKKIGVEIVKKCKGVPLALIILGCLLSSQYDEREWKKVRNSEFWKLDQHGKDSILPALKLSYNKLPPQLKQCFSICSVFPKDYRFNNQELVGFWMAHGLLQSSNDEESEYVGELYIKKLTAISFFQMGFKNGYIEEATGLFDFKMHDLVHDLASSTMISEQAIDHSKLVNRKVRHLSFSNNLHPHFDPKLNKARTIISQNRTGNGIEEFVYFICNEFKYLRVLDFQNSGIEFLPKCLGKMKHLRYLNLQSCSRIKKLPDSICKLQNLQTLNLLGCMALEELPRNLGKYLVSLRALVFTAQVTDLSSFDIGCFKCLQSLLIFSCHNLVSLPWNLRNLTSLKRLVVLACSKLVSFEDNTDEKEGKNTEVVNDFSLQMFTVQFLPNLTALPGWLTRYAITSLETLIIKGCPKLSSLPADMNKLRSLQDLYIMDCPELEGKCKDGSERSNITHVANLHLGQKDSTQWEDEEVESEEVEDKEEA